MAGKSDALGGGPPRWAEFILQRILAGADSQTVTGDLREEYVEAVAPRAGRLMADIWYLRQIVTLAPRGLSQQGGRRVVLLFSSLFVCACGCWLALMEWLLRHPGYFLRSALDVAIALIPLATIVVLVLHLGVRAERGLLVGAVALIGVAVQAVVHASRSAHFEGFVVLISLALLLQGGFMLVSLGRAASR